MRGSRFKAPGEWLLWVLSWWAKGFYWTGGIGEETALGNSKYSLRSTEIGTAWIDSLQPNTSNEYGWRKEGFVPEMHGDRVNFNIYRCEFGTPDGSYASDT